MAQAPCEAETILSKEFGLSRRDKSEVWISPREVALRRRLGELPRLVDRARALHEGILAARERNRVLWSQRQALEETLKKNASQLSPSDPQRKQLEEKLKTLDSVAVAPEKLGGAPWVQPRLIDVSNTRHSILLTAFAARRDAAKLKNEYATLFEDPAVAVALRQLGGGHRLGPLKDYSADVRRLDEFEQFVYSQPHPLYLQSGQIRVGAILNERAPVTFSWRESSEPTVITTSIAQRAGITANENAATITVNCPDGRNLEARQAKLGTLRFGSCVLRDVDVYILPPEGEDRGADIAATVFVGYRAVVEPGLLRLRIEPVE